MSGTVQNVIQFIDTTMYHHGFIKILIKFHLKSSGDTWENFLIQNHFKQGSQEEPSCGKEKRGRKRKIEDPVKGEQQPHEQSEDEVPIAKFLGKLKKRTGKKKEEGEKGKDTSLKMEMSKINKNRVTIQNPLPSIRRSVRLS